MVTANIFPDELEFFEGINATKKICTCASQKDCIAVITGVSFGGDVPDYIKDNLNIQILDKMINITSTLSNTNVPEPLFNYQVEIAYQKPLITTEETANIVMKEHVEKLKNDEGIKAVKEILTKLEQQFPSTPIKPIPTVVTNVTNQLVVGSEISSEDIEYLKTHFTAAVEILRAINYNYFRNDFKNINNSNVIKYVSREFNKFTNIYDNNIIQWLTSISKNDSDVKIAIIKDTINTSINIIPNGNVPPPNNFSEGDRYTIKNNIIEINNTLIGVYTAYIFEYDNGILNNIISNTDLSKTDKCL